MIDYPEITYKYRSWDEEFHKKILLENEIYFASPKELNDIYDCRIPINWSLLKTEEDVEEFIRTKIRPSKNILSSEYDTYKKLVKYKILNDTELQDKSDIFTFSTQDEDYGILSLSKEWNIELMWSHYANSNKGFCVGFRTKDFIAPGQLGYGHVSYYEKFPQIHPLDNALNIANTQIYSKSIKWKYEDEFRILQLKFKEFGRSKIYKILDSTIAEIILGINMKPMYKEAIIEIAKNKNIKIFQAVRGRFEDGIQRSQIF